MKRTAFSLQLSGLAAAASLLLACSSSNNGSGGTLTADASGTGSGGDVVPGGDGVLPTSDIASPGDDATAPDAGGTGGEDGTGGTADGSDTANPPPDPWDSLGPVFGVPNVDDDNRNKKRDFDNGFRAPEDNDFAVLVLPAAMFTGWEAGDALILALTTSSGKVRVWLGDTTLLGNNGATAALAVPAGDLTLDVEFNTFLAEGQLAIGQVRGAETVRSVTVRLLAAPLTINHHRQGGEHMWVVRSSGQSNKAMVDGMQAALGDALTVIPGASVGYDVWVQDEMEWGLLVAPGQRMDLVIDSIRDRGLKSFPPTLEAPHSAVMTWGNPFQATSLDSFGNLEASPPVTADGVDYPLGRIYFGGSPSYHMTQALTDFLRSQKVQKPVLLNSTFLCVGHVDEWITFVPDDAAPRGFRLFYADTDKGYAFLEKQDANWSLGRYKSGHGYATVGELLKDGALRAYNKMFQEDYLTPNLEIFKKELGILPEELVLIPSVFEEVSGCGGAGVALIPGMINLQVVRLPEVTKLFIADPYFRPDGAAQSSDPMIEYWESILPPSLEPHYLDDWYTYHLGLGEIHCGTNVRRKPMGQWWTEALHLIDGGN